MNIAGLAKLFEALPQLDVLKHEDMPSLDKLTRLQRLFAEGDSPCPAVFVGNNALFTELELAAGPTAS